MIDVEDDRCDCGRLGIECSADIANRVGAIAWVTAVIGGQPLPMGVVVGDACPVGTANALATMVATAVRGRPDWWTQYALRTAELAASRCPGGLT